MPGEASVCGESGNAGSGAQEPCLDGAFSDDGVDLTLIRWMLERSPAERLAYAQGLVDAAWMAREAGEA